MSFKYCSPIFLLLLFFACTPPNPNPSPNPISVNNDSAPKLISSKAAKVSFVPPFPKYPVELRIARVQGDVIVEVTVNTDGVPTNIKAVSGPTELWPVAENYFSQWRYLPLLEDGKPIAFRVQNVMNFRLK